MRTERGFPAESRQVFSEEGLYARQAEMGEAWALVEKCVNALCSSISNVHQL